MFRGECEQLEQLIEGVGEIIEEEVPVVPRYLQMSHAVAVAKRVVKLLVSSGILMVSL